LLEFSLTARAVCLPSQPGDFNSHTDLMVSSREEASHDREPSGLDSLMSTAFRFCRPSSFQAYCNGIAKNNNIHF
jgi:hypothetical protein